MSEWITDRRPTEADTTAPHYCVYDQRGYIVHHLLIADGEPWKPIQKCEPYVKSKRYTVDALRDTASGTTWYEVWDKLQETSVAVQITTHEAAERIAAIYEEVMP